MNFKNYIADIFDFVLKRVLELMGIILIFLSILLGIALGSYSPDDPNFIFRENLEIKNLLGKKGSFISDFLMQAFGLISIFVPITIFFTGLNIFSPQISQVSLLQNLEPIPPISSSILVTGLTF